MKTLRRIIKDQRTKVALAMAAGLVLLAGWLSAVDRTEILARLSTVDLRWIDIETDADVTVPGVGTLSQKVDIDPMVYNLNLGYRF